MFKTNYTRYQINKQKVINSLQKMQAFENAHRLTSLGKEYLYT